MNAKFRAALLEGTGWSAAGLLAVAVVVYLNGAMPNTVWKPSGMADFVRRWDGGCTGWTQYEAIRHLAGGVMHWWSYCTIAFVYWRLHPPLKTVPYSAITLTLTGLFILGCGIGHLISCMTMFWPAYTIEGDWLIINGVVSCIATVFVAFALVRAFEVVHQQRQRVADMTVELNQLRKGIKFHD